MGRFEGKVVIITGAGRGIGREHALLFAKEGAQVLVNDPGLDEESASELSLADRVVQEITDAGGTAAPSREVVGTFESAEQIVQSAIDSFGRVDILVNNAGILRDRTILNMTPDEWNSVLDVHLTGTFSCLQAAAKVMVEQGHGGRIINTSSSSGLLGNFGQANYGAAKAGIYALTRIAAMEFAKHKITVNAIAPVAWTQMLETFPNMDQETAKASLAASRVAPIAAYLATDEAAAARITGMTIGIEGNEAFAYRMMTSHGATRYANSPWTIEDVGKSLQQIVQW